MAAAEELKQSVSTSVRALIHQHGADPISWSLMQPGLSRFETRHGVISFRRALGFDLTLGPPLCAPSAEAPLLRAFLAKHPRALFFYVREDFARRLQSLMPRRFFYVGVGTDRVLELDRHLPEEVPEVRAAARKAAKAGLTFREVDLTSLNGATRDLVRGLNETYLARQDLPYEMRFLNRPLSFELGAPEKTFLLEQEGRPFGFATADPYFEGGRVRGYMLNQVRFGQTKLWGLYLAVVAHFAKALREDGVKELSLGFVPLFWPQGAVGLRSSRIADAEVRWMSERLSRIKYVRGLWNVKSLVPSRSEQRFFATPLPLATPALFALFEASGVRLRSLVGRSLFDAITGAK